MGSRGEEENVLVPTAPQLLWGKAQRRSQTLLGDAQGQDEPQQTRSHEVAGGMFSPQGWSNTRGTGHLGLTSFEDQHLAPGGPHCRLSPPQAS